MSGRSRIWQSAIAEEGQAETIALSYVLPFNATLLQWSLSLSAVPTTDNLFTIVKESVVDPALNVTVYEACPTTDGLSEYICNGQIEFRKGDTVTVTFLNEDDLGCGVELCFTEGD